MSIKQTPLEERVQALEGMVAYLTQALRTKDILPKTSTPLEYMVDPQPAKDKPKQKARGLDLSAELTKRHITHNADDIERIGVIISQYTVNEAEILQTLDKVAIVNSHDTIRNLPAYVYNTFKFEHAKARKFTGNEQRQ